jgi:hypothetical protein
METARPAAPWAGRKSTAGGRRPAHPPGRLDAEIFILSQKMLHFSLATVSGPD